MWHFRSLFRKLLDRGTDRSAIGDLIAVIDALEPSMRERPSDDFPAITHSLRQRAVKGEALESLLPEAFAACREAARRTIGLRPYGTQLRAGIEMNRGHIIEMQTGEGKTLAAALTAYLNALTGKGVHIACLNAYLAERDAEWMGKVYAFLGVSVGLVRQDQHEASKRSAYRADITYSTYSELGFDYLRDNLKTSLADFVQRQHAFAIVDEVDSILIDEAKVSLIISTHREDSTQLYNQIDEVVSSIPPSHVLVDTKTLSVTLTDPGVDFVERQLRAAGLLAANEGLYQAGTSNLALSVLNALRARHVLQRDRHYIVTDRGVKLVNQNTGRMLEGHRLSEGLHQAVEAKEQVSIVREAGVSSSISIQNYFRLYEKMAGMSGTVMTDRAEFSDTYGKKVVAIPPHVPVRRKDYSHRVFANDEARQRAVLDAIQEANRRGQPVLIGTTSVEKSARLSKRLSEAGIRHDLLNAKELAREAQVIANAGRLGAVTVATNMAGRGTDIQLGGDLASKISEHLSHSPSADADGVRLAVEQQHLMEKQLVAQAGGLLVIATELHESRRIDNQLRGRAGRQGDPGASCFYLSLDDELFQKFGPPEPQRLLSANRGAQGEQIYSAAIERFVTKTQLSAEARNAELRRQTLEYDDVFNHQRKIIFALRKDLMSSDDPSHILGEIRRNVSERMVRQFCRKDSPPDSWDWPGLAAACQDLFMLRIPLETWAAEADLDDESLLERIRAMADEHFVKQSSGYSKEALCNTQKLLLLRCIDKAWCEHLAQMEHLRSAIHYRAAGRRTPLMEFRVEALDAFEQLLTSIQEDATRNLAALRPLDRQRQTQLLAELVSQRKA